jgi:hypothetical protein
MESFISKDSMIPEDRIQRCQREASSIARNLFRVHLPWYLQTPNDLEKQKTLNELLKNFPCEQIASVLPNFFQQKWQNILEQDQYEDIEAYLAHGSSCCKDHLRFYEDFLCLILYFPVQESVFEIHYFPENDTMRCADHFISTLMESFLKIYDNKFD